MPVYKCPRCDLILYNKNKTITHITNNKCKPEFKKTIPISVDKMEDYIIPNPFKCICDKTFSSKSNLEKHVENNCKGTLKEISTNITQNITQNIQNNIIVVLPHNKPDISYLTDADYYSLLGRNLMSIPKMIEKIHFNEDRPQNQNIYISNIKNKYAMLYDGSEWSLTSKDETIHNLIVENETRLEDWLTKEDVHEKYPNAMTRFELYLSLKEKDANLAMIKQEIQLLLYNKRNMIKNK